jgi:hypothetical protein
VRLVAEKLSWEEIKMRYPDEWVALVDYDWPDGGELVEGVVYAHSQNHGELIKMQKALPQAAVRWTGRKRGEMLRAALHVDR